MIEQKRGGIHKGVTLSIKNKLIKLWEWTKRKIKPYLHWKILLVFGMVWILSTGIWYVIAFAPIPLPSWLKWFARAYIGFLWLPTTPEKMLTIPLSMWLYKKIFKEEAKIEKESKWKQKN